MSACDAKSIIGPYYAHSFSDMLHEGFLSCENLSMVCESVAEGHNNALLGRGFPSGRTKYARGQLKHR